MEVEVKTCGSCRYFHQHYVRLGGKMYVPLDYGHCGHPRSQDKRTNTLACSRHVKRVEER